MNEPYTVTNGDLREVTAESIMEAYQKLQEAEEQQRKEPRVGCIVMPIEDFPDASVVQTQYGPEQITGMPFIDIGQDRYVFDPEFYDLIMGELAVNQTMPLQLNRKQK